MMFHLVEALYYIIPTATIVFFIASLFGYHYAKNKNKQNPDAYSPDQIRFRKICLIVSSVIAGIMLIVFLAFIGILMMAIAYM